MDHFAERERIRAMKIICRAYRPGIPLAYVSSELGFVHSADIEDNDVEAIREGQEGCIRWLKEKGAKWAGDMVVDTKASLPTFLALAEHVARKGVDIKGQSKCLYSCANLPHSLINAWSLHS